MNWENPLFLIPIITGPVNLLMAFIMLKFPPKSINALYGFRSSSAMESQVKWDFAQAFFPKQLIKWSVILTMFALVGLFLNINEWLGLAISLSVFIGCIIMPVINTNKAITAKFGEN